MGGLAHSEPLVAVVTPVCDGARHLRRCLESVLRQVYENWIHLVVDAGSCDRTLAIAEEIAARDDRVVVLRHERSDSLLGSFDRALAAVPGEAVYVKQLHAQEALFPESLRLMVEAAERHPLIGIASGRRYAGGVLHPDRGPERPAVVRGEEAARAALLGGVDYLGSPSLPLLRRERVAGWPRIFGAPAASPVAGVAIAFPHAVDEAYLPTLEKAHLAFVPRALVDERPDPASPAALAQRLAARHPSRIELILRHGARLLGPKELRCAVRRATLRYARSLAWRAAQRGALGDGEFVRYHAHALAHLVKRLRECERPAEAALLAPFAALLRRRETRAAA
jgi:glycosyltransferase involved in cell wall biosynthesis